MSTLRYVHVVLPRGTLTLKAGVARSGKLLRESAALMWARLVACLLVTLFTGTASMTDMVTVGGDRTKEGCIPSAGYSWCDSLSLCIRAWETACPVNAPPAAAKPTVGAGSHLLRDNSKRSE